MPAHNPEFKDREFGMDILVVEKKSWNDKVPDGHFRIMFRWRGGSRTWEIEGILEPGSPFMDTKHNWQWFDKNLPKGQGDAIVRLLDWVRDITSDV